MASSDVFATGAATTDTFRLYEYNTLIGGSYRLVVPYLKQFIPMNTEPRVRFWKYSAS